MQTCVAHRQECGARWLHKCLLIGRGKENASRCLPVGDTALRQPCHVLLKLGLLLQNTSAGFYARDLGLLNLRAEVISVVIKAPLFSTFFSPLNVVVGAHL